MGQQAAVEQDQQKKGANEVKVEREDEQIEAEAKDRSDSIEEVSLPPVEKQTGGPFSNLVNLHKRVANYVADPANADKVAEFAKQAKYQKAREQFETKLGPALKDQFEYIERSRENYVHDGNFGVENKYTGDSWEYHRVEHGISVGKYIGLHAVGHDTGGGTGHWGRQQLKAGGVELILGKDKAHSFEIKAGTPLDPKTGFSHPTLPGTKEVIASGSYDLKTNELKLDTYDHERFKQLQSAYTLLHQDGSYRSFRAPAIDRETAIECQKGIREVLLEMDSSKKLSEYEEPLKESLGLPEEASVSIHYMRGSRPSEYSVRVYDDQQCQVLSAKFTPHNGGVAVGWSHKELLERLQGLPK